MALLVLIASAAAAADMPQNLNEGKALAEMANNQNAHGVASEGQNFTSFAEMNVLVNDNPQETGFSSNKLRTEAGIARDSDETYAIIADNQEHRNYEGFKETIGEGFLDAQGNDIGESKEEIDQEYYIVECQTPGDIYEISCTNNLQVTVNVIPELRDVDNSCHNNHKKKSWLSGTRPCDCQPRITIKRQKQVLDSDAWIDDCVSVEELHNEGLCELVQEIPDPPNQTRTISGEPITRAHWQTTRIYRCGFPDDIPKNCNRMDLEDCAKIDSRCNAVTSGGVCMSYTHRYRCPGNKIQLPNLAQGQEGFCLEGGCLPTQRQSNHNIFNALSRLEILRQMQKQIADINAISIFKGEPQACTTNFGGGFKDCCKGMRGYGLNLKLAQACSADEHSLAGARAQGRSVSIGSYVKNKHLGINFSKAQVFCTFPTKIARIFQQEARKQLGINWGEPQNPNCRGLSLQELQSLDFEKMDLSELYTELTERIKRSGAIMQAVVADKTRDLRAQSKETVTQDHKSRLETNRDKVIKGGDSDRVY